jgi:hypothetical protein
MADSSAGGVRLNPYRTQINPPTADVMAFCSPEKYLAFTGCYPGKRSAAALGPFLTHLYELGHRWT